MLVSTLNLDPVLSKAVRTYTLVWFETGSSQYREFRKAKKRIHTSNETLGPAVHICALIEKAYELVIALHLEPVQANKKGTTKEACGTCDDRGTGSPEHRGLIGSVRSSHCWYSTRLSA